tara:strand:+ start:1045 stop:1845 length:801 start_codon:yes stop_codon:yes gene_type:complete
MARIDFLGTGNAFAPHGRLHALAIIDKQIIIDAPPTLIFQLRKAKIDTASIKHILFTHWHADHTFGFPFFLLERKYISDAEGDKNLTIHLRPNGKFFLTNLCNLGFPRSLEDDYDDVAEWNESEKSTLSGTDWKFERFAVCHTPETDPHGYELTHENGFVLLHCGDSGPCEEIELRAGKADVIVLEMGMPDIGNFPYHHTPKDIISFSKRFPNKLILVTHNYASSKGRLEGFQTPVLPNGIHQLEDGDFLIIRDNGTFKLGNIDIQ